MTPKDAFTIRVTRRLAGMEPEMARALLRTFQIIRDSLSEADLVRFINGELPQLEALSDEALDRALIPFRAQVQKATEKGFQLTVSDLPKAGKVDGVLAVAFNHLSPSVITAVRELDAKVLTTLKTDIRETVRAYVEQGLRTGNAPRSVAREIRLIIGLGKSQLQEVENFRDALLGENGRSIKGYSLRNKTVDRLLKKGELTPEQVERYTELYRKARITQNSATIAHTATVQSYKAGQQLAWEDAKDKGVIPDGFVLKKQWMQIQRPTKRDEHIPLNGEVVNADDYYSNGQFIPGEDDYNCACTSRFFLAKVA